MADLYTSLVRAKQELNGGVLPAMTPIPENVRHFIDPDFTPGLGALEEDPEKGLRCPVRGCGRYFRLLGAHLDVSHADVGGQVGIRHALSLPPSKRSAPLVSRSYSERRASIARAFGAGRNLIRASPEAGARGGRRGGRVSGAVRRSVCLKNLRNACEAQMVQRLLSVQDKIGRTPSKREAIAITGSQVLAHHAVQLYGSWNGFLSFAGQRIRTQNKDKYDRASVLTAFSEWYNAHGSLPTWTEAKSPHRTPWLPSVAATQRRMGTTSWPEAMRMVASALGIRGGRYGVPLPEAEAAD